MAAGKSTETEAGAFSNCHCWTILGLSPPFWVGSARAATGTAHFRRANGLDRLYGVPRDRDTPLVPRTSTDDVAFLPAVELLALLDQKELSSLELLDAYLDRVARHNPTVNAIVTLDAERARQRAEEADAAKARGESWGPLHGLPVTVKDVFETDGLLTTAGSPELAGYVPDRDAELVRRLRRAGAIVYAKTNTPTLAADGQTFNPLFGTTNNPWDLSRTPGGSSGGCGAALAAGLTPLSFGSDIAGSIRIPASFCGVYGHKPSFGLVPQRGHIPGPPGELIERDINVVGPLARDPRDLEVALSVLAGPLGQETLGWQFQLPLPPDRSLDQYRVAAWLDDPACPVDTSVTERLEAMVDGLRAAGAVVDTEARPGFELEEAVRLFQKLLWIREDPHLTHAEWLALDERRQACRDGWASLFHDFDVLVCPVCSTPPFPHDQRPREQRAYLINGEMRPLSDYVAWPGLIGMAYLPSTSSPLGCNRDGMPIGVQVVGPYLADRRTMDFAAKLRAIIGGFERPPGF
jgi:amidase